MRRTCAGALVAVFIVSLVTRAASAALYGVGPFAAGPSNLYRIDDASGVATVIGSTGVTSLGGLAGAADGTLYAYTASSLYTLNPATGGASFVGPLGLSAPEGGLSVQPATGTLFGVRSVQGADALLTINTATGAATIVGALGDAGRDTSGLAFRPGDGALFGAAFRGGLADDLVRIDTATGAASTIGPLGTNVAGLDDPTVGGLEFDALSGVLYYSDGDRLYTVNPQTGAAAVLGAHGVSNVAGLAFVVPEPTATATLAVAGIAIVAIRRRRRESTTRCSPVTRASCPCWRCTHGRDAHVTGEFLNRV